MLKKLLLLGGLTAALTFALVIAGGNTTKAAPGDVQGFDLDMGQCLVDLPDTVSSNPQTGVPQICGAGENKAPGPPPAGADAQSTNIGLIGGNRLGYPYVYSGPGWVLQPDAGVIDGTQVGDVASAVDLYQDGTTDILGDISNCGGPPNSCTIPLTLATAVPDQYVERTTAWGLGTGCSGEDEGYLSDVMPGASAMVPYARYRACLDTLFLQGLFRVDLIAAAGAPTPLNLVTMDPNWGPAGMLTNLVLLSGAADSPGTGLTGIDSPQASISHTLAIAASSPVAPGLYARWVTEMSAADEQSRALNFVLTTNCKAVGGVFPDADADCLSPTANPGASAVDGNDANPDQDGDGLPDGVEVAWGSNPLAANSDGDSRSDLEEMLGPTQFLTNPKVADTDLDGKDDGGHKVDGPDGGLAPDFPDENGDGVIDGGTTVLDTDADGSSHRRSGFLIIGEDILPNGAGVGDNCPSLANNAGPDAQKNADYDSATEHGNGDLYGDACDGDDDQDEIVDDAELTFQWDSGSHTCSNDIKLPGAATQLNPLDLDTDNDGIMDGVECLRGSNPNDAGDTPGRDATDGDNDAVGNTAGLGTSFEVYQRSFSFSGAASEDFDGDGALLIGDNDPDSDGDGLPDGWEAFVTGTSLASTDTDGDGTADGAEPNLLGSTTWPWFPRWSRFVIPRAAAGAEAYAVKANFVGATILMVTANEVAGGTPVVCPSRPSFLGPNYLVSWPQRCAAFGDSIEFNVLHVGAGPVTLPAGNLTWVGSDIPEPGGPWNSVATGQVSATDLDGDGVANGSDNCPWVSNSDQANTDIKIGNGKGIAGDDGTVPWSTLADKRGDACDGDLDNDGMSESTDPNSAAAAPGVSPDITYDDNADGTWKGAGDDGTLWDGDPMNAKLDGRETLCPAGVPTTDGDGDGLSDRIEVCKWGSSPIKVDSDGNGKGDCNEIVDTNGDGQANLSDVVNGAKAALLGDAAFGKDGDFDINGDNAVNISDVTIMAQKALITGSCK